MRRIGFVISRKENERRRAMLPRDLGAVRNRKFLFFESGYGEVLDIPDEEYRAAGGNVVSREESRACDIVCNPKTPEPEERPLYGRGQTLFGWIHAVQGREIVDFLLEHAMTAIAWEDMYENGRHLFWENNESAGEAAVLHAFTTWGREPGPYRAAVLGRGNCARGAFRTLSQLGMRVTVYDPETIGWLRPEIGRYDIIVNAVLWDVFRTDHLIYRKDLARMKPGALIIDISCDPHMGVETSQPTTIADPVYTVDGIMHYAVDHTPSLFFKTVSASLGAVVSRFIDDLVEGKKNSVLERATVIMSGRIIDERISRFQKR
jgi:N5-(carboxyethyl)ornithine synthase